MKPRNLVGRMRVALPVAGVVLLVVAYGAMLLRDRGGIGRIAAFEVDGTPYIALTGQRYDSKSGGNLQVSVITWDVGAGRRVCRSGAWTGGFGVLAVSGRHAWIDRSSTAWPEIALWDLATCEERFSAAHYRAGGAEFGGSSTGSVDSTTGSLSLGWGAALNVDGTVTKPPEDTSVLPARPSSPYASCRYRSDVSGCHAVRWCASAVDGQVRIAAEGEEAVPAGPAFTDAVVLGSPGFDRPCAGVLEMGQGAAVLVRHAGRTGEKSLPPGVALVTDAGDVPWNAPLGPDDLYDDVIAVLGGGEQPITVVSAYSGSMLTGGYHLRVLRLDPGGGAVLARFDLP